MYTVCPQCQTRLQLGVSELKEGRGRARCGNCNSVFDALAQLHDDGAALAVPEAIETLEAVAQTLSALPPVVSRLEDETEALPDSAPTADEDGTAKLADAQLEPDELAPAPAMEDVSSDTGPAPAQRPAAVSASETVAPSIGEQAFVSAREDTVVPFGDTEAAVSEDLHKAAVPEDLHKAAVPADEPGAAAPSDAASPADILAAEASLDAVPHVLESDLAARAAALPAPRSYWRAGGLLLVAVSLTLLLVFQYMWFHAAEVTRAYPGIAPMVEHFCTAYTCAQGPARDPDSFHIIAREVRAHPSHTSALAFTAAFAHRAPYPQRHPFIKFTLYDVTGYVLAERVFSPLEYLGAAPLAPLEREEVVHIALDMLAPEDVPLSFEIRFL